jgi:hypothetical protein
MAILARVIASEALCRIRDFRADLIGRVGEQRMPIFDERPERIISNRGNIRRQSIV